MNKLQLDGPVWLASDIHLGPTNPKTAEIFFEFLDLASAHAGALVLLGDIFDFWIGDDWIENPPSWLASALDRLSQVGKKIPLWIGRGNRDFLMSDRLCQRLNARLLDEQCILYTADQSYLLAHGDEFCIADQSYQRFRKIVRNALIQKLYLKLSIGQRERIAQKARQKSMQSQAQKSHITHDVDPACISAQLKAHNLDCLIHGHTHRPGHFTGQVQGFSFNRWVLPDWEADHLSDNEPVRGGWLVINDQGAQLHSLSDQNTK